MNPRFLIVFSVCWALEQLKASGATNNQKIVYRYFTYGSDLK